MPRLVVPSLFLPEPALGEHVELLVVREDQVGVAADPQPAGSRRPWRSSMSISASSTRGVDDDAVADDRRDVVVEDRRSGTSWRAKRLAVDHDGVPGVVAALVADDQVHLLGDEVGELALALVAPLGPDDDGRRHGASFVASLPATEIGARQSPHARCGDRLRRNE